MKKFHSFLSLKEKGKVNERKSDEESSKEKRLPEHLKSSPPVLDSGTPRSSSYIQTSKIKDGFEKPPEGRRSFPVELMLEKKRSSLDHLEKNQTWKNSLRNLSTKIKGQTIKAGKKRTTTSLSSANTQSPLSSSPDVPQRLWFKYKNKYGTLKYSQVGVTLADDWVKNPVYKNLRLQIHSHSLIVHGRKVRLFAQDELIKTLGFTLFFKIFQFLTAKELCIASQTCKVWKLLIEDKYLWKLQCEKFESPNILLVSSNWKLLYAEYVFFGMPLFNYLKNYDAIPESVSNETDRCEALIKIAKYYEIMNRPTDRIKKIFHLYELHQYWSNFAEAAKVLLSIAEDLSWSDHTFLPCAETLPKEAACWRKARLYERAIDIYGKGKYWERGLKLLGDLASFYFKEGKDNNLNRILKLQEEYTTRTQDKNRFAHEYFFVEFIGKGFQNKPETKLVYRGIELERLEAFVTRIKKRFPNATILYEPPTEDLSQSENQYIQVKTCRISSREEIKSVQKRSRISDRVDDVNVFVFSKQFKKTPSKSASITDLWVCNTYLITKELFPNIKRESEVVEITEKEITPIENSIMVIEDKNAELEQKIDIAQTTNEWSSSFTMALKGVIDAAVNGGVDIYKKAFFTEEYEKNNPFHVPYINQLKNLLKQQINILDRGLQIHQSIHPKNLQGLHEQLQNIFDKMKHDSISSNEVANYIAEEDKWKKLIILEEEEKARQIRVPAAVKIQKVFRGYLARKQYQISKIARGLFPIRKIKRTVSLDSFFPIQQKLYNQKPRNRFLTI